jgi:hypothetical protein
MQERERGNDGPSLISNRMMEVIVALVLLAGCAIVIQDSIGLRLPEMTVDVARFRWQEGSGPGPGYFPFWVAVILGISSLVNLVSAIRGQGAGEIFVAARPFARVLAVLIPSICYVALVGGATIGPVAVPKLGIYLASAIFILVFMVAVGRENPLKALGVAVLVPVALFLMFEKWFLVPLPTGPIEAWLGY